MPFRRFDVALPEDGSEENQLVWKGQIDPNRSARLLAWNTATSTGDERASGRGTNNGEVSLNADITSEHVDGSAVHSMGLGDDSLAYDVLYRVEVSECDTTDYEV